MLINQLTEARHRLEKIKTTLDALDRYTKEHFQAEKALMIFRHYENLDEHRKQHQAFEEWLQAVKMVYSFSTSPDFFAVRCFYTVIEHPWPPSGRARRLPLSQSGTFCANCVPAIRAGHRPVHAPPVLNTGDLHRSSCSPVRHIPDAETAC